MTLSYARQVNILGKLTYLADRASELAASLQAAGFDSFVARRHFLDSFCEPTEQSTHERYLVEVAKTAIGTPDGISGFLRGREPGFRSPILAAMRAERDATNGVPYDALLGVDIWKREIDPCARRMMRLEFAADPVVSERRRQMDTDRRRRHAIEIARHVSDLARSFTFDPTGCSRLVAQAMQADLGSLGFEYDRRRSRPFSPVLSKRLTPSCDLCWSLRTDRNLQLMPRYQGADGSWRIPLDPCLYVAVKGRRGNLDIRPMFKESDTMVIRYTRAVAGFEWAYGNFESLEGLETILKAHATLLKLIAPAVVSDLVSELS
jgi:hypothetical protein